MSTKIYNSYKLKRKSDLWPLVRDIRIQATKNVKKKLKEIYKTFISCSSSIDQTTSEFKDQQEYYTNLYKATEQQIIDLVCIELADAAIVERYKKATISMARDFFNFDVSVGFRQNKGKIYLKYYADMEMRNVFIFLVKDPRLEEYHYQNQTDPPDYIPEKDWGKRRKEWNDLIDNGSWEDVLTLDICRYDMYYMLNPQLELKSEILKKVKL
jgi:hypothetical protein